MRLSGRVQDARDGFEPRIEWVIGPSRVGKSALIKRLQRMHPEGTEDGRRRIPALVVRVKSGVSPSMLPFSVIKAIGAPAPPSSAKMKVLFELMDKQLRLAGTRALLFEEASHLVDLGSRVLPRAAGDWFKEVAEELGQSVLMFGVPKLEKLFKCNEQLEGRASAALEFRPYDSQVQSELDSFTACVTTYADMFQKAGYPFDLPVPDLAAQCYLLTGGRIGILSKFMQELATALAYEAPRAVTLKDCQVAAATIGSGGHPDFPAFSGVDPAPAALAAAHSHVLVTNGMSVRSPEKSETGK